MEKRTSRLTRFRLNFGRGITDRADGHAEEEIHENDGHDEQKGKENDRRRVQSRFAEKQRLIIEFADHHRRRFVNRGEKIPKRWLIEEQHV